MLPLSFREKFSLQLQRLVSIVLYLPAGGLAYLYVKYIRRIKFRDLKNVRQKFLSLIPMSNTPILICANHLTMFDSIYLHYGLVSYWNNLTNPRIFSWNVAAVEIFKSTPYRRILTYIGKTMPVDRHGETEHLNKILDMHVYLLSQGNTCTVFPEGGRSRSGLIEPENVTYGVGRMLQSQPNCTVLCVYMRGKNQKAHTVEPMIGDEVYLAVEKIEPRTDNSGMRGARDLSIQIINKLKEMEDHCFETTGFQKPAPTPS